MAVQPSSKMCTAELNEVDGSANCCSPDEPPDKSHSAHCSRSSSSSKNPAATVPSSQQLQMKKSSFQIMCVVPKSDGDSVDDLDDVTNTEDVSSDVHAAEVHPDHWSSAETIHSPCEVSPRSPNRRRVSTDSASQAPNAQSRFRIVKVESRAPSRVRGRWTCMDFSDPPLVTETSSSEGTSTGENACAAAAHIYFVDNALKVPFTPAFVYSGDHLVLERTPLNTLADNNIYDTVTPERNSGLANSHGIIAGFERLEPVTSLSDLADAVGRPGDFATLTSATLMPSDSTDNADRYIVCSLFSLTVASSSFSSSSLFICL